MARVGAELARDLADSLIIPFNVSDYAWQLEEYRLCCIVVAFFFNCVPKVTHFSRELHDVTVKKAKAHLIVADRFFRLKIFITKFPSILRFIMT